jgi:hypothetical protein
MKEREEGRGIENPTLQREEARLLAARRVDVEFDGQVVSDTGRQWKGASTVGMRSRGGVGGGGQLGEDDGNISDKERGIQL